ncbi:MAG: transposase [Gammaproteobacteria bacterium]|nr:transposase [Gammaproteobacteria bacterium]
MNDDNPFSEKLFRTLKYTPCYSTRRFDSIAAAKQQVHEFIDGYNGQHRHSAIHFLTPNQPHRGEYHELLNQRKHVHEAAKNPNPERWSGRTRN